MRVVQLTKGDAVIVSNHGGRQLDSVRQACVPCPKCSGAANGRIEVLMDGGIRRSSDIVKAMCLGAKGSAGWDAPTRAVWRCGRRWRRASHRDSRDRRAAVNADVARSAGVNALTRRDRRARRVGGDGFGARHGAIVPPGDLLNPLDAPCRSDAGGRAS